MTNNDPSEETTAVEQITSHESSLLDRILAFKNLPIDAKSFIDISWPEWRELYRKAQHVTQEKLLLLLEDDNQTKAVNKALKIERLIFRAWSHATDGEDWRNHNLHGRTDIIRTEEINIKTIEKNIQQLTERIAKKRESSDAEPLSFEELESWLTRQKSAHASKKKEWAEKQREREKKLAFQNNDVTLDEWLNACAWRMEKLKNKQPEVDRSETGLEPLRDLGLEYRYLYGAIAQPDQGHTLSIERLGLGRGDHQSYIALCLAGNVDEYPDGFKTFLDIQADKLVSELSSSTKVIDTKLQSFRAALIEIENERQEALLKKRHAQHDELMTERAEAEVEERALQKIDVHALTPAERLHHEYRLAYLRYFQNGFDIREDFSETDDSFISSEEQSKGKMLSRISEVDSLLSDGRLSTLGKSDWEIAMQVGLNLLKELELSKLADEHNWGYWADKRIELDMITSDENVEADLVKVRKEVELRENRLKQNREDRKLLTLKLDRLIGLSRSHDQTIVSTLPSITELRKLEQTYLINELRLQAIDLEIQSFRTIEENPDNREKVNAFSSRIQQLQKEKEALVKAQISSYPQYRQLIVDHIDSLSSLEEQATDPAEKEELAREMTIALTQRHFRSQYVEQLENNFQLSDELHKDYYQSCKNVDRLSQLDADPSKDKLSSLEHCVLTSELKLMRIKHQLISTFRSLLISTGRAMAEYDDLAQVEERVKELKERIGLPDGKSSSQIELGYREAELELRELEVQEKRHYQEKKQLFDWTVRLRGLAQLIKENPSKDDAPLIGEQAVLTSLLESATKLSEINDLKRDALQQQKEAPLINFQEYAKHQHHYFKYKAEYGKVRSDVSSDVWHRRSKELEVKKSHERRTFQSNLLIQLKARVDNSRITIDTHENPVKVLVERLKQLQTQHSDDHDIQQLKIHANHLLNLHAKASIEKPRLEEELRQLTVGATTGHHSDKEFGDAYKKFEQKLIAFEQTLQVLFTPSSLVSKPDLPRETLPHSIGNNDRVMITFSGINRTISSVEYRIRYEKKLKRFHDALKSQMAKLEELRLDIQHPRSDVEKMKQQVEKNITDIEEWRKKLDISDKAPVHGQANNQLRIAIFDVAELEEIGNLFIRIKKSYDYRNDFIKKINQPGKRKSDPTEADKPTTNKVRVPTPPGAASKLPIQQRGTLNNALSPLTDLGNRGARHSLSAIKIDSTLTEEINEVLSKNNVSPNVSFLGELPAHISLDVTKETICDVLKDNSILVFNEEKSGIWQVSESRLKIAGKRAGDISKAPTSSSESFTGFTLDAISNAERSPSSQARSSPTRRRGR